MRTGGTVGEGLLAATRVARVALHGPLDVAGSLRGFGRWGDDLIDRWDGLRLLRVVRARGREYAIRATVEGSLDRPALRLVVAADAPAAVEVAVAGTFVGDDAQLEALDELAARDAAIARIHGAFPGIRPVLQSDPLTALVRSISAQQVNLRWAATIRRRIAERYGTRHLIAGEEVYAIDAERLALVPSSELRALQLTTAKATSVLASARAAAAGRLALQELDGLDDEAVIEWLVALPGIGRWSAEWFLARTLGRPRVVAGDLGVRKAVGLAYFGGRLPSESEVRAATAHWGSAAGLAQQLLLHDLGERVPAPRPAR